MTSGSLDGVMASTLARNARDVGLSPALGAIVPIFTPHPHDTGCCDLDPAQAMHCLAVEPALCIWMCKCIA